METATYIAITIAMIIMPGYFWIRGILKRQNSDTTLAVGLAVILTYFRAILHHSLELINQIGIMIMAMGLVLLIVGTIGKTDRLWKIIACSVSYIAMGFFLFVLL